MNNSNMADSLEKGTRKRKAPPVDPDNAEVVRLQRNAERKQAREAQTLAAAKEPTVAASTQLASHMGTAAVPSTNTSRQPSIKVVDDEDDIQAMHRPKPKNSNTIIESSDDNSDEEVQEVPEPAAESAEAELSMLCIIFILSFGVHIDSPATERLKSDWNAPIYAFFKPTPDIAYKDSRRMHVFKCLAKNCRGKGRDRKLVNRFLDKGDARSTSNLRKHAKLCWSEATIKAADATKNLDASRSVLAKSGDDNLKDGKVTASFERLSKGENVTYLHTQHTKTETKFIFLLSVIRINAH